MQTITKEIKTRVVDITPSEASQIWDDQQNRISDGRNPQRNLQMSVVELYAADMRSGAWAVTHQGLAFDVDGNLIDGQHRLHAIILAGVPVTMMVTTGIAKRSGRIATIDAIDGGKLRTHGDKFHMHGVKNANQTSSSVNAIVCGVCGPSVKTLSFTQIADAHNVYSKEIAESINILSFRNKMRVGYITGPIAFALAVDRGVAVGAATQLATLADLTPRHPVSAFNRAIEEGRITRISGSKCRSSASFHLVAAMVFALKNGATMQILRPNQEASDWFLQSQAANVRKIIQIAKGYK